MTFPFSTQSRLFAVLLSQAANDPDATSRAVPVPTILDALLRWFGEGGPNMDKDKDKERNQPQSDPVTLSLDELQLVHSLAMQTVYALLSRDVPLRDVGNGGGRDG